MIDTGMVYVIPASQKAGHGQRTFKNLTDWVAAAHELNFNPKPPNYWFERKRSEGSTEGKQYSDAALGMIWWHRYDIGRRISIWLQAPERDFIDAGYLVKW